jgi:hypothetical protein
MSWPLRVVEKQEALGVLREGIAIHDWVGDSLSKPVRDQCLVGRRDAIEMDVGAVVKRGA